MQCCLFFSHFCLCGQSGTRFVFRESSFLNSKIHSFMAFKPGGGEKSSERKAAFSPPPGPPPLFWPRLSCKKMPAAFSTNWAVTRKRECASGVEFLLAKKKFCPTHFLSLATRPNTNQMPSGICTAKRRLWVVQLYIRFEKALPPRNGVRLHLTFHRLASLVGIGHEWGWGPGKGQRANRNALAPSPGFKTM